MDAVLILITCVHQKRLVGWGCRYILEECQIFKKIRFQRLAGFDFNGENSAAVFDQKIYFITSAIAPIVTIRAKALIQATLHIFDYNEILKQGAAHWVDF